MGESIEVYLDGLEELKRDFSKLRVSAPEIVKMAVNETAIKARQDLYKKADSTYKVKKTKFNKSLKLNKASVSSLTATIHTKGRPLALSAFEYRRHTKAGRAAMAHQLQSTRPVQLGEPGYRAFVARMQNAKGPGHLGIFVRVEGSESKASEEYRKSDKFKFKKKPKPREQIREFFGSSVPVMVGGERVFGSLKNQIEDELKNALRRHAERILNSMEG